MTIARILAVLLALTSFNLFAAETRTLVWPDGTRYVGGVVDGKRSGKGTIFWQDGTRFVGQFENDKRNGPGTMILPDGTVYTGFFKDDVLVDTEETLAASRARSDASTSEEPAVEVPPELTADPVAVETKASEPVLLAIEKEVLSETDVTALTVAVEQELTEAVDAWAAAWSNQEPAGYISAYSTDFFVPGRQTREEWEALRESRIKRPQFIRVTIDYDHYRLVETNIVDVYFTQHYESNTYRDVTQKALQLRKEANGWKILRERSL